MFRKIWYKLNMNKAICLILLSLVALSASTYSYGRSDADLWLSRDYQRQAVGNDWYGIQPYCYGGSGQYDFSYGRIPAGWKDFDEDDFEENRRDDFRNSIFIPTSARDGKYQIQVSVYDIEYRVEITRFLIIDKRGDDFTIFVRETYDSSFRSVQVYEFEERDIIEFPSWKKIEMLIEDGSIREINDIVDRVIDSDNDCDDKEDFLNGVLSRIHRYIATRNDRLDDQEKDLRDLQRDLKEYEERLSKLLRERKVGNKEIDDLRDDLKKAQGKVAWFEKRISNNRKKINKNKEDIEDLKKKIWRIKDVLIPKTKK